MPNNEKLLTVEEQDVCQEIAASGERLAGQRAAALLAIDGGATRAQASKQTGLTVGQIGYLLHTFRQKHLAMFPDAKPKEHKGEKEAKKSKKGKKAKAEKKPKKDKKAKKGKKDKAAKKKSKKK
jgi:hypothetical protein